LIVLQVQYLRFISLETLITKKKISKQPFESIPSGSIVDARLPFSSRWISSNILEGLCDREYPPLTYFSYIIR